MSNESLVNYNTLYDNAEDFFVLDGNAVMIMTTEAAIAVCRQAAEREIVVMGIEGGGWRQAFVVNPMCIWDGLVPPVSMKYAHVNNLRMAKIIESESATNQAFILTTSSIHERRVAR